MRLRGYRLANPLIPSRVRVVLPPGAYINRTKRKWEGRPGHQRTWVDVYAIQGGEKHYGLTEPNCIVSSLEVAKLMVFKLYKDAGKIKRLDARHWQAMRSHVDYVQITKVRMS
jgi:hypothetical protein